MISSHRGLEPPGLCCAYRSRGASDSVGSPPRRTACRRVAAADARARCARPFPVSAVADADHDSESGISRRSFIKLMGASAALAGTTGCQRPVERIVGVTTNPPNSRQATFADFSSDHPSGAQFVFCDGSVHFLSENIDYVTYQRLGDRRDGQPVGDF